MSQPFIIKTLTIKWKDEITHFLKTGIWRIQLTNVTWYHAFFVKCLRIVLFSIQKFNKDRCPQMASALTFYSLLSIVPVLAMAFGIAKGFGFEKIFEIQLYERLPGQEEALKFIIDFAYSFLENVKGGMVAGIGAVVLFWAVINVLGNIENSFNTIWEIKKSRPLKRKFSDYLSIMLICPVLVIMSGSITVFIRTQLTLITAKIALIGFFSPVIFFFLKLLPYVLIWILFILTYLLMPNTRVRLKSGVLSGIIAGTVYQLAQWAYISFQIGVSRYNAIYGSFSAFPLFLIWIQLSWYIVLLGAEMSYAFQNVGNYEFELDFTQITPALKKRLSFQISHMVIRNFSKEEPPLTVTRISESLKIPVNLVLQILHDLKQSRIITETIVEASDETAFQPAIDIQKISITYLLDALDHKGFDNIPLPRTRELELFSDTLDKFRSEMEKSPENKLIKDI